MKLLNVSGISKSFYGVSALKDINFDLLEGEVLAIVGENGAGKSTMINILAGVLQPDEGDILLREEIFRPKDPSDARKAGISVIFQDLHLIPQLSVAANIFLHEIPTRRYAGIAFVRSKQLLETTAKLLADLDFDINPAIPVERLSRAVRQQVEIAKALATNAKLIIMDEPTASLEAREVEKLFQIISQLKARGTSVIFVSHRLDEVLDIADRVTVFRDGQLVGTKTRSELNANQLVKLITGRDMESTFNREPVKPGNVICQVKNVKSSGIREPVNLELKNHEILSFTGLIGSGYSNILKVICGHETANNGEVRVTGAEKSIRSPYEAINNGIGYIPEDRKKEGLFMNLSVESNIAIASLNKISRWGFISRKRSRQLVDPLIKALKIKTPSPGTPVKNLSGGNQQKVILARWLASNAKVLALLEPTHGIDIGAKFEVYKLLNEFANERGTVVFSSSELPEVLGVSDRIIVFQKGKATLEVKASDITNNELLNQVFGAKKGINNTEETEVIG